MRIFVIKLVEPKSFLSSCFTVKLKRKSLFTKRLVPMIAN